MRIEVTSDGKDVNDLIGDFGDAEDNTDEVILPKGSSCADCHRATSWLYMHITVQYENAFGRWL